MLDQIRLKKIIPLSTALLVYMVFLTACQKYPSTPEGQPTGPTLYNLNIPAGFPDMDIPTDNPMTIEGIALGRMLFYDSILSADNSQSCGSCHQQAYAFTDGGKRFSEGIDKIEGTRNSMQIINSGWTEHLFWDGRSVGLEMQALEPVPNPIEMHQSWPDAMDKLNSHPSYPDLFFKAFGKHMIDSTLVVKAIAQFERTLISSNSKWDKYLRGEYNLTQAETRGYEIFFTEKGDCFHCHTTILYTDNLFHNNGLDSVPDDLGLYDITGDENDKGKFKTPTLRNINFTGPYMHDGRFESLEDVVDFYSSGVKWSPTIDPLMKKVNQGGIQLNEDDKEYLIAFIKTLTDETFISDTSFSNPFK